MVIPTAEEYAHEYFKHTLDATRNTNRERGEVIVQEYLINFAKMHVKAALEAAVDNVDLLEGLGSIIVDDDSILNAYPEENIK